MTLLYMPEQHWHLHHLMVKMVRLLQSVTQYQNTFINFYTLKWINYSNSLCCFYYLCEIYFDAKFVFFSFKWIAQHPLCLLLFLPRILFLPNPTLSPASFLLSWVQVSLPHQQSGHWVTQIAYAAGWGRCWNSVVVQSQHCLSLEVSEVAHWPAQAALYGGCSNVLTIVTC